MLINKLLHRKIVALYEAGKKSGEIGDIVGVTRQRVCQILAYNKITSTRNPPKIYTCRYCSGQYILKGGVVIFYKINYFVCRKCGDERSKTRKMYWCPKFLLHCCKQCGTNKIKHKSNGLCRKCFAKKRNYTPSCVAARKRYFEKNKQKIYEQNLRYRNSREGKRWFAEYYQKNKLKIRERARIWWQTEKGKESLRLKNQKRKKERAAKKLISK